MHAAARPRRGYRKSPRYRGSGGGGGYHFHVDVLRVRARACTRFPRHRAAAEMGDAPTGAHTPVDAQALHRFGRHRLAAMIFPTISTEESLRNYVTNTRCGWDIFLRIFCFSDCQLLLRCFVCTMLLDCCGGKLRTL